LLVYNVSHGLIAIAFPTLNRPT